MTEKNSALNHLPLYVSLSVRDLAANFDAFARYLARCAIFLAPRYRPRHR